jgi:hypothetical protein
MSGNRDALRKNALELLSKQPEGKKAEIVSEATDTVPSMPPSCIAAGLHRTISTTQQGDFDERAQGQTE